MDALERIANLANNRQSLGSNICHDKANGIVPSDYTTLSEDAGPHS